MRAGTEVNRLLLIVGTSIAVALTVGGWRADARGEPYLANVLVEMAGVFATLVLIDWLLPRAMGLWEAARAGSAVRLRQRIDDEVALTQPAFIMAFEAQRGEASTATFDLFRQQLEQKWGRQLDQAEFEALANAITVKMHEATTYVRERRSRDHPPRT